MSHVAERRRPSQCLLHSTLYWLCIIARCTPFPLTLFMPKEGHCCKSKVGKANELVKMKWLVYLWGYSYFDKALWPHTQRATPDISEVSAVLDVLEPRIRDLNIRFVGQATMQNRGHLKKYELKSTPRLLTMRKRKESKQKNTDKAIIGADV